MPKKKKSKIKVRKTWTIKPVTQIGPDETKEYNRTQERQDWQAEIEDELENDLFIDDEETDN
jgi:hypothetical protein